MKIKLKPNEFKCDACDGVFEKSWSDEDAEKEALEIWGNIPQEERCIICDDCFKKRSKEEIKEMGEEYKTKVPRNLGLGFTKYYEQWGKK